MESEKSSSTNGALSPVTESRSALHQQDAAFDNVSAGHGGMPASQSDEDVCVDQAARIAFNPTVAASHAAPSVPGPVSLEKKAQTPVALDDSTPPPPTGPALAVLNNVPAESMGERMRRLQQRHVIDQHGNGHVVMSDCGNPYLLKIGGKMLADRIRAIFYSDGKVLTRNQLEEIVSSLEAKAQTEGIHVDVWQRVAPIEGGGVELDAGDDLQTRVRITPGHVEVVTAGSTTLFVRAPGMLPMVLPGNDGDYRRLKPYLNLDHVAFRLFVAWLTYTLASPKSASSRYLILVLIGGQGSGKTFLTKIAIWLLDNNRSGVQTLPRNVQDLAIALQSAHLRAYDNLRAIAPWLSDAFCMAATGGTFASRKLYTDDLQSVLTLHGAFILNGIYAFVVEPDLAQRCLTLHLEAMDEQSRKSETDMLRELEQDMPAIMRGLFDLMAKVFVHLPNAVVTAPTRMYEFSKWLAAMESVDGAPAGIYQDLFAENLRNGQLEGLTENLLAATVISFAEGLKDDWSGTPSELLAALNQLIPPNLQRHRDWPSTPISLSKRLQVLQAPLLSQGISINFSRGKTREITIVNTSHNRNDQPFTQVAG